MRQSGRARLLYAVAAFVTLVATALFVASKNYVCSSTEGGSDPSCGTLIAADVIVDVVILAIGLGATAFFVAKAVRASRHL